MAPIAYTITIPGTAAFRIQLLTSSEDAIEGITHSICTLEFEDHRPLYDWVVTELGYKTSPEGTPKQIEFAKLYLTNVVTGKIEAIIDTDFNNPIEIDFEYRHSNRNILLHRTHCYILLLHN